jgi:hypothetical protein
VIVAVKEGVNRLTFSWLVLRNIVIIDRDILVSCLIVRNNKLCCMLYQCCIVGGDRAPVLIFPARTCFSGLNRPGDWWYYFVRVRACGFPLSALSLLGNFDRAGSLCRYIVRTEWSGLFRCILLLIVMNVYQ